MSSRVGPARLRLGFRRAVRRVEPLPAPSRPRWLRGASVIRPITPGTPWLLWRIDSDQGQHYDEAGARVHAKPTTAKRGKANRNEWGSRQNRRPQFDAPARARRRQDVLDARAPMAGWKRSSVFASSAAAGSTPTIWPKSRSSVAPIAGFAELDRTPVLHPKSNNHLLSKSVFRTIVGPKSVIKPTGGRSRRSYQRRIVLMPQERSVQ